MPMDITQKDPTWQAKRDDGFDIEPLYINLGPSHPAMHGTVKMVAKLDGETVVNLDVQPGYLHRCF